MATSRYSYQTIVNSKFISTFPQISPEELQSSDDIFVKLQYGKRIDNLAYEYLGDGRYWWVIALLNGLNTPFDDDLIVGKIIRIPSSINNILSILENKANG